MILICIIFIIIVILQGEWIWIKPQIIDEFAIPIGCQIVKFDRGLILVRNSDGHEKWITTDHVSKSYLRNILFQLI